MNNAMMINPNILGSTTVQIVQPQVVSTTNSQVNFSPTSTSWGYGRSVVVRVIVKDNNNNPLSNINVLYIRLYNQSGSTVIYNDSTAKTTNTSGEVQYTIAIDNIQSSYVPQNAIVEAGVQDGQSIVRLRPSSTLNITGKATSIQVTANRSSYNYGETITLSFSIKDNLGNTTVGAPVYVRIKQGTTIIKDFGRVYDQLGNNTSYSITVNTTNFPSAGSYTIEVADNSSYSAQAGPMQLDLSGLISLVFVAMIPAIMIRALKPAT